MGHSCNCNPTTYNIHVLYCFTGNLDSLAYQCLLKNELLGAGIVDLKSNQTELNSAAAAAASSVGTVGSGGGSLTQSRRRVLYPRESNNLFQVCMTQLIVSL